MTRTTILYSLFLALICAIPVAFGHGPQLQVTTAGGKLVTNSILPDEDPVDGYGPATDPKRVYVMPLINSLGDGQYFARPNSDPAYYSGPGFAYGLANLENGSSISLTFLAGLLRWDGSAFADPGLEQLQAFRGSYAAPTSSTATVDGGASASLMVVSSFLPGTYRHSTSRFRILGDGVSSTAASDDGVYLAAMRLSSSSTSPSVADSDPYYFLLHKNALAADVNAALASLLSSQAIDSSLVQIVPEPSSLALLSTGALLAGHCIVRQRRRRA